MFGSLIAILAWLAAHWDDVLTVAAGIVAAASVIVRVTPTQTDDRVLGKVLAVLEPLALSRRAPAVVSAKVPPAVVEGIVDKLARGDADALREVLDELEAAQPKDDRGG